MANKKSVIALVLLPLVLWGSYFILKNYYQLKPKPVYEIYTLDEQIILKYSRIERMLEDFAPIPPQTALLEKIITIEPQKPKIKKRPKYFIVKYIIITDTQKIANVNGKLVRPGDIINGAKVVDIKKECVLIRTKKGQKCIYIHY